MSWFLLIALLVVSGLIVNKLKISNWWMIVVFPVVVAAWYLFVVVLKLIFYVGIFVIAAALIFSLYRLATKKDETRD